MDVYKHIPSKDIREYLQKINYQFTQMQAAYIIWNDKNCMLFEKQEAFKQLMEEYPDETVQERMNTDYRESLHAFLEEYIFLQNTAIGAFYDNKAKNAVYRYRFYCEGDFDWCENYEKVFSTYEALKEELKKDEDLPIVKVQIRKSYLDDDFMEILLMTDKNGEVIDVDFSQFFYGGKRVMEDVFDGYWLDIPLPFKRGDVLQEKRALYGYQTDDNEPFVLYSCHNWNASDYKNNGEKLSPEYERQIDERYRRYQENGDITDTFPCGYGLSNGFVQGINKLYRDVMDGTDFLSLEYYQGDYENEKRLLRLLSKRMKGEIDDELFAHGHFLITQEEYIKEYKRYMNFLDEVWKDIEVREEK